MSEIKNIKIKNVNTLKCPDCLPEIILLDHIWGKRDNEEDRFYCPKHDKSYPESDHRLQLQDAWQKGYNKGIVVTTENACCLMETIMKALKKGVKK